MSAGGSRGRLLRSEGAYRRARESREDPQQDLSYLGLADRPPAGNGRPLRQHLPPTTDGLFLRMRQERENVLSLPREERSRLAFDPLLMSCSVVRR